jgi:tRNA threonylcarbamoyladenosine biosynthesis protein TsaB
MRILAIETTDIAGSVAALEGQHLVASQELDPQMRSAQSLAPGIAALLESIDWKPSDVKLVAVAVGPGSFTGLRVGVTTAKLFAYAVGAEALGINTLEVIAAQVPDEIGDVWAVLDALRGEVVAAHFLRGVGGVWQRQGGDLLVEIGAWLAMLTPGTTVNGPALAKLSAQLPAGVTAVDRKVWMPKAATVGQLAWTQYQAGRRDDLFSILPHYYRRSAAEEKRDAFPPPTTTRAKK